MSARYHFKVGPANRHIGYADPVSVLAESFGEAKSKAISFSGFRPQNANAWLISIEELPSNAHTEDMP